MGFVVSTVIKSEHSHSWRQYRYYYFFAQMFLKILVLIRISVVYSLEIRRLHSFFFNITNRIHVKIHAYL